MYKKPENETVFYCDYSVGEDPYTEVPGICLPLGRRALLIGGKQALAAAKGRLLSALAGSGLELCQTALFGNDCTDNTIHAMADLARQVQADMIFGMGGGKALDTAKGAADEAGLPVFTFPTIAATCAAATALSVVYREDGTFEKFLFYERPARHCFIDLTVIANAPDMYLQAGMGDTLGKYFESRFSARGDILAHSSALGVTISGMCCAPLLDHGVQALRDCRENRVSFSLEQAVLANIISTGLVSLLVLDDYNCAIAHSVCYGLDVLDGFEDNNLHGNVVAYGILVQLLVDGDEPEARKLKAFLEELEIPTTLAAMGVALDRALLDPVLKETVNGPDMAHIPYPVTEDMVFSAMVNVEKLPQSVPSA